MGNVSTSRRSLLRRSAAAAHAVAAARRDLLQDVGLVVRAVDGGVAVDPQELAARSLEVSRVSEGRAPTLSAMEHMDSPRERIQDLIDIQSFIWVLGSNEY